MSPRDHAPHSGRLVLEFVQRTGLTDHFEPLRLPDLLSAQAEGIDGNQIDTSRSLIRLALRAGEHQLPLNRRQPLRLRITEGTTCRVDVTTKRANEPAPARAIVSEASLRFDPPLALFDVAPTLLGLQELFTDRDALTVRELASTLWSSPPATRIQSAALQHIEKLERQAQTLSPMGLPLGATLAGARGAISRGLNRLNDETRKQISTLREVIEDSSPHLPVVQLDRVTARPVRRRNGWRLELRFSGRWGYEDLLLIPFEELRLPALLLPAPAALLEQLSSPQPLESAVIDPDRWPVEAIAKTFAGAIRDLELSFEADLRVPSVGVALPMSDRGLLDADLRLRESVHAEGTAKVKIDGDRLSGEMGTLSVQSGNGQLNATGDFSLQRRSNKDAPDSILTWLTEAALRRRWPIEELTLEAKIEIAEGSRLPSLGISGALRHPLARGGVSVDLNLMELEMAGAASLHADSGVFAPVDVDLRFSTAIHTAEETRFSDGVMRLQPELHIERAEGTLRSDPKGDLRLDLNTSGELSLDGEVEVRAFPELSIEDGTMKLRARGSFEFEGILRTTAPDQPPVHSDFAGTNASLVLYEATVTLDQRSLSLPAGSCFSLELSEALLATTGLGQATIPVSWDLQGQSPLLRAPDREVEVFVSDLRQGAFNIHISQVGGMHFSGIDEGLYDFRLFNALVNPGAELDRWIELLGDDEAVEHILATVAVFSTDAEKLLSEAQRFAHRLREVLDEEEIERPGDFLPAATIARVLSRVLADSLEPVERIHALVTQVVSGEGFDVPTVKQLLQDYLPENDHAFEIDRGLRILSRALTPTEPVPPLAPETVLPLTDDPALALQYEGLPSAETLYQTVDAKAPLPLGFSALVARIAPYLTRAQLSFLVNADRKDWRPEDLSRIHSVLQLKKRIALIAEEYGGGAFLPQAWAIGFFIGQATHPHLDLPPVTWAEDDPRYRVGTSLLGPAEVATLLNAGIAAIWEGSPVQINQRLLIELMLRQPPSFVREVLAEASGRSAQALTGVLFGLLDLKQQRMKEPLDIASRFSEALGLPIPKIKDYMAGGRWARQSHYEALFNVAEQILAESKTYRGLLQHLQVRRTPATPPCTLSSDGEQLAIEAQAAIARADERSSRCTFRGHEPARRAAATQAWGEAFEACRTLIAHEPLAFQLSWLKTFWGRNHEALVVLSVLRNVQQKVDDVPRWLQIRLGRKPKRNEQGLLEDVIEALYTFAPDRKRLLADPLVRLLIDPPPGHYNFTVISAMGVITEGAAGTELKDAYARLEDQRGIKVIRANTQTARTLKFNAARIEEAVQQAETPWGWIGYSQGCANGFHAESLLLSGTPSQRALADRLRCRNLLFSAANGSAHGTCGDWKLQRVMADADRFLKHYQSVFSERAIQTALHNIRAVLDSPPWVKSMGGVQSLSHDGVRTLAQDGQYKAEAPTSILRGVVETSFLPEGLEMLSHALTAQTETSEHDTQVTWQEAVGHPIGFISPWGEVLQRCDMGCMVQRTHHWSPLFYATELFTTERDRRGAVYDFPKDRHVFPWIEVNARFGIIERR